MRAEAARADPSTRRPLLLSGALFVIYAFGVGVKLAHGRYTMYDQGTFHSWLVNASQGRGFLSPFEGGSHHFHIHFSPLLYAFVPPYLIGQENTPVVLLVGLKLALYALSGALAYLLGRFRLPVRSAALLALFFASGPIVLHNVLGDIHDVDVALPLLLAACLASTRDRPGTAVVFLGLACGVKEELFLVAALFCVYLALRTGRRRWYGGTVLFGAAFGLVIGVVMPAFPPGGMSLTPPLFGELAGALGSLAGGEEITGSLGRIFRDVFVPPFWRRKLVGLAVLSLLFLGLPLRSPRILIPVLPTVAYLWLNQGRDVVFDFRYRYCVVLLPFLLTGFTETLSRLRRPDRVLIPLTVAGLVLGLSVLPLVSWKHFGPLRNDASCRELAARALEARPSGPIAVDNLTWQYLPPTPRVRDFGRHSAGETALLNLEYGYLSFSAVPGDARSVLGEVSAAARFHLHRDGVLVLSSEDAVASELGMVAGPPPPAVLARTVWDPPVPGIVRRVRSFLRGE
jgi:uncharacterized membrane protein